MKKIKNNQRFNIIYEENNSIIPEIDDNELLNFGMAFMQIRARELNNGKGSTVKNELDWEIM